MLTSFRSTLAFVSPSIGTSDTHEPWAVDHRHYAKVASALLTSASNE